MKREPRSIVYKDEVFWNDAAVEEICERAIAAAAPYLQASSKPRPTITEVSRDAAGRITDLVQI